MTQMMITLVYEHCILYVHQLTFFLAPILSPDTILTAFPANVTPDLETQNTFTLAPTDVQPSVSSIQPSHKGGQRIRKMT